jgi:hypothetical protein
VAGRLNAHPEIVLFDQVSVNSGENGFRHLRLAVVETAADETDCFRQIRLFSSVHHILLPVSKFRAGVAPNRIHSFNP